MRSQHRRRSRRTGGETTARGLVVEAAAVGKRRSGPGISLRARVNSIPAGTRWVWAREGFFTRGQICG
jgi:hypothetical protein